MSVLIRGMEMPTSCMACLFQTPYMGGWCSLLNDNSNAYSRRRDCPLIPAPPHGRLIDSDELKTAFPCGESVRTECVRATIDHAPTVIPAEEGENDV